MLSEIVCIKCWIEFLRLQNGPAWSEEDEDEWNEGVVSCPSEFSGGVAGNTCQGLSVDIDKAPPKWCPHKLEHAVAETVDAQ